jgi:hypothetical protein
MVAMGRSAVTVAGGVTGASCAQPISSASAANERANLSRRLKKLFTRTRL